MNEKKYLAKIKRMLRCAPSKKREIVRQIRADIRSAMEGGEGFSQVIGTLGTPGEIAAEFNGNMSEEEMKRARREKRLILLGGIVVFLLAVYFAVCWLIPGVRQIGESKRFSEDTLTELAKQAVQYMDAGDYGALQAMMHEKAAGLLTGEVLEDAKVQVMGARGQAEGGFGAFQAWGNVYIAEIKEQGQYAAAVEIGAAYENISVVYTLFFNEDMKLTGVYMR